MKICLPILGFGREGGMRSLSLLANEWTNLGHNVTFISHASSPAPYYPTIADIEYYYNDGRRCLVPEVNYCKPSSIYAGAFSLYRALNQSERNYDVAIANFFPTAFSLKYARMAVKKYYYVQAYEPGFFSGTDRRSYINRALAKRSYELGLEIIVNARSYYDYDNIESNRLALPPVDLTVFRPKTNPGSINNKVIKIGMIGRNIGWKGGEYVMKAFESLRISQSCETQYHLFVAFGDPLLASRPNVHIVSPKNDAELASFYREMDIFVAVPTLQYGAVHYPVVEALASGTPLITTGYYPATSANSWLVEPHSADAIASAVQSIVANPLLALERAKRGLVDPQEYCVTKVAEKFLEYLQQ